MSDRLRDVSRLSVDGADIIPHARRFAYQDGTFGRSIDKQMDAGVSLSLYASDDGATNVNSVLRTLAANEQHIIIPDGVYLNNGDPIELLDNQTITGVGGELLVTSSPTSSAMFLADGVSNVTLRGLRSRLTSGAKYLFYGRDTRGITIENNAFGRPDALWLGLCFAYFAKGCEDVIAAGNRIYGGQAGFGTGGDPLDGLGTANGTVRNVIIERNLIYRTTTEGIDINWDTDGFSIVNNWLIECGTRGEASNQVLDIGGGLTATFTASIAGTTLTITSIVAASGGQSKDTIAVGDILYFGGLPAGIDIRIAEQLTGSAGGTGTYRLSEAPGDAASAIMRVWSTICRNGIVSGNFISAYDTSANANPAYRIPNSGIEVKGGSRNVTVSSNTLVGVRKAGSFGLKYSSGYDCDMEDNDVRGFAIGGFSIGTCVRAHMRSNRFSDVTQIGLYTTFGSDMRYTDCDYTGNIINGLAATDSGLMLRSADRCDISRTVVKGGFNSSSSGLGRGVRIDGECTGIKGHDLDVVACYIGVADAAGSTLSGDVSGCNSNGLFAGGTGGEYRFTLRDNCTTVAQFQALINTGTTRATLDLVIDGAAARAISFPGAVDAISIARLDIRQFLTTAISGTANITNFSGNLGSRPVTVATLPSTALTGARAVVSDANATTFGTTVASGGANSVPVIRSAGAWNIG